MKRRLPFALALAAIFPLGGCGPTLSTYLIISAQAELDGAKAADAEKHAVYEYTAASEYLAKAREEQGYADFGPAIDYAYKATELARQAQERAEKEKGKERPPEDLPPDFQPAPEEAAPAGGAPQVIIKKTTVEVVPVNPEEGTRPPQ